MSSSKRMQEEIAASLNSTIRICNVISIAKLELNYFTKYIWETRVQG
jgi:hypothetical protein